MDNVDNMMNEDIMEWLMTPLSSISTSSSSTSIDDSDEDDNSVRPNRIAKINNYIETIVPSYNDVTFKEHFRISRAVVHQLIGRFERSAYMASFSHTDISTEKYILLSLWYLSNTESFRQISDRFNVSLSSAHRILTRVLDYIISLREMYIKWPSEEQKVIISNEFERKHGFRGVIGCIDGTHFKIYRPKIDEEVYVNRKGFHSILLQGIVDHKKLFIDVYCGEPGSLHDARLLRKSSIFRKAENPGFFGKYYLLGDSAYPSTSWLVPPFRDNGILSEEQKFSTLNYHLPGL